MATQSFVQLRVLEYVWIPPAACHCKKRVGCDNVVVGDQVGCCGSSPGTVQISDVKSIPCLCDQTGAKCALLASLCQKYCCCPRPTGSAAANYDRGI